MSDRTSYSQADVAAVKAAMERHTGPDQAGTTKQIAAEMGLRDDRKLRQILSDYDGEVILLGKNERGIFLATSPDQAAAFSAELDAKIWTQLKRRSRRKRLARAMFVRPVEQLGLGIAS